MKIGTMIVVLFFAAAGTAFGANLPTRSLLGELGLTELKLVSDEIGMQVRGSGHKHSHQAAQTTQRHGCKLGCRHRQGHQHRHGDHHR